MTDLLRCFAFYVNNLTLWGYNLEKIFMYPSQMWAQYFKFNIGGGLLSSVLLFNDHNYNVHVCVHVVGWAFIEIWSLIRINTVLL